MQTVVQAVEIVAYVTDTPRNRVNQLARALVSAGVLPKSSGRDIKKIDGGQMLGLVSAVAFADIVTDAPAIATEFMNLPFQSGGDPEAPAFTLGQAFTDSMAYREWKCPTLDLSRVATGYTAMIHGEIIAGSNSLEGALPFWVEQSQGGWVKRSFILDRSGVDIMRNLFVREDIEGMHFRR